MVSIRDVAQQARVSISTVSRVLSGSARVEPSTRARIEKIIKDTGYRPNVNARGLRSRSGQLVGLVVPDFHETFSTIIHYAEHEAFRMGFGLIVGNTNGDPDKERKLIADLLSRNVDAIIFSRLSDASHVSDTMRIGGVPLVGIDRGTELEDIPSVELDNREAGRLVGDLFTLGGHRNVGMVMGPQDIWLARDRSRGFLAALRAAGIQIARENLFEGPFDFEAGLGAAQYFLSLPHLPTAIWVQCDPAAVGLLHGLLEAGVRIPDDVSIVGMDNVPLARMVYPSLTTVEQPLDQFCTRAFEIIQERLDNPERQFVEPEKVRIVPSLIRRESYRDHVTQPSER